MDRTRMPWELDTDGAPGVPESGSRHAGHRYSADDTIFSGDCRGIVAAVDIAAGTVEVRWSDSDGGAVTYPMDAEYLTKVPT